MKTKIQYNQVLKMQVKNLPEDDEMQKIMNEKESISLEEGSYSMRQNKDKVFSIFMISKKKLHIFMHFPVIPSKCVKCARMSVQKRYKQSRK